MHAFRIGRVFGVDIRVDYSWVFIFLLLTWNLVAVFSHWHPDWPGYESAGVAVAASLLFFACILVHELAHSVVAMGFGVRVRNITLFLFGGVSNIEREPPSAQAEFLTAVVGPITSIGLGLGFMMLASVATPAAALPAMGEKWFVLLGPIETLLVWLGPINVAIGLFNMLPAFPLDGGRVLRSIFWAIGGNLRSATRLVSYFGQAFGWLFIVTGIAMVFGLSVPFFGTGLVSGLWLAFIGWFLRSAASQEYNRLAIDDALAGHTVAEIMRREPPAVPPELPLSAIVQEYFVRSDERTLPVVKDDRLLGVISMSDVRALMPADWSATTVSMVMRPLEALTTATPDEPLIKAFETLARLNVDQLPVLEGDRLVGMLLRRDVARWLELAWGPLGTGQRPDRRGPRPPSVSRPYPPVGHPRPHPA